MITKETNLTAFKQILEEYWFYFYYNYSVDINFLLPAEFKITSPPRTSLKEMSFFSFVSYLGEKMQKSLTDRKYNLKNGKYYTNNISVVDLVLKQSINFKSSTLINSNYLEPACGYGIFLLRTIYLINKLVQDKNKLLYFINKNLFAFDISELMVFLSKLNIKLLFYTLYKDKNILGLVNPQIFLTDTTYKSYKPVQQLSLFDPTLRFVESNGAKELKEKFYQGQIKIDYIFGNPPYVTFYGRRDKKKSEKLRRYYIENYSFIPNSVKNGKLNLSMFFIEQAIEWLKIRGRLSFILDISFLETAYRYIRKYILDKCKIISIISDITVFDVASGQIILSLEKTCDLERNLNHSLKVYKYGDPTSLKIEQKDYYNEENEYKFDIIPNEARIIIEKIEKKSKPLTLFYPKKSLRTCCMLLNMENLFTVSSQKKIDYKFSVFPYYEGSKSLKEKYGKLTFSKYFIYNKRLQDEINNKLKEQLKWEGIKNKKRIGLGDLDMYKSPKLFIRQSAKEIISTLSMEPGAANNSLYCLSEKKNILEATNRLKVVCAQLNSTIVTFYAQVKRIIRYSKGKQPQIKISDLKKVPLFFDKNLNNKLISYVDNIYQGNGDRQKWLKKIDALIFDYYEIDKDEKSYIEKFVNNY